jgi:hypothetical protein
MITNGGETAALLPAENPETGRLTLWQGTIESDL